MSTGKNVVVLTPNGRRQTVKVTSNTTILQILEEVCSKHKLNSDEYDIKHHNTVLDTTLSVQFSGLPNNAQLELTPVIKQRTESQVTLGVQFENGERLMGTFQPSQTLWDIISTLCPNEQTQADDLVIIYMRREVYGVELLQKTTLRQLGLTGGRAMIRLVHRNIEELKVQANVSTPLPAKPVEEKPYKRTFITSESKPLIQESAQFGISVDQIKAEKKVRMEDANIPVQDDASLASTSASISNSVFTVSESDDNYSNKKSVQIVDSEKDEQVVFLGERNALVFSLEMAKSLPHEDLPDEFFNLTVNDARKLLRDMKQRHAEMEEQPLQTEAMRSLEKDKKILRNLNKYKTSVLRIFFPDRTVLQGTFKPTETIEIVMDFVRSYLEDISTDFHLYTTPPKEILDPSARLIEIDCVPCAVLHFGTDDPNSQSVKYLKKYLFGKLSSFSGASLIASKSRGVLNEKLETDESVSTFNSENNVSYPASNSEAISRAAPTTSRQVTDKKVPKWFKPL